MFNIFIFFVLFQFTFILRNKNVFTGLVNHNIYKYVTLDHKTGHK